MDNTADFPETQPTLNPHWKEALDKAMHQSLMRGRVGGMEKGRHTATGSGKRPPRDVVDDDDDDDDSMTLSDDTDDDSRRRAGGLSSSSDDDDDEEAAAAAAAAESDPSAPASSSHRPPPPPPPPPPPAFAPASFPPSSSSKRTAAGGGGGGGIPPSVVLATPGETTDSVRARLEQNRNLQREEKMELLGRLHYFMDEKGFRPFKTLGPEDSLEDIRYEVFRAQRELSKRRNCKFMAKALVSVGAGLEMANSMYNPLGLRLDGFSKSLLLSIKDYDEIFEELHWKYCDAVSMPPELRLVMTLGSSIFFYHLSNNGPPATSARPMSPPRMPPPTRPSAVPASVPPPPMQQRSSPMQRKMAGPRSRAQADSGEEAAPAVDMTTLMSGLSMVNTLMGSS